MLVQIPDTVIQELVDATIIQTSGSLHSVESRSQQATRLQWHFAEYVTALIAKELRNRKVIGYDPTTTRASGKGNGGSNQG